LKVENSREFPLGHR